VVTTFLIRHLVLFPFRTLNSARPLIQFSLAAADNVQAEPLSSGFQGVLGLALPLNSVIASLIPPVIGNSPDGAAFASNLFGITPTSAAPAARFISLSLSRPGSDQIPSLLGIGQHPSQIVTDPTRILYGPLVSEQEGVLFWKTVVQAITVYVNGQRKPVVLSHFAQDSIYTTATLDSGVPLILTTSAIANGIYGAIGINPASDGQCKYLTRSKSTLHQIPLSVRLCSVHSTSQHDNHTRPPARDTYPPPRPHC
jgi:hypothetical protein